MRIHDEYGTSWVTRGGDPGMRLVNRLKSRLPGLDLIVLPRLSLITGALVDPDVLPDDIIYRTRLLDCVDLLKGSD